ncbi:DNA ligase (ATP) [Tulasnella sp. JGI-2019a]|nr:DNA ligase (ATP) [Tulasnella sp. JGI-2019a]
MVLLTPDESPTGSPPASIVHGAAGLGPEYEPGHLERPAGIFNDKPSPPFSRVVGLFDVLRDSKPQARKDKLDHWFTIWRSHVGNDLYPAMRLILPHKDRERATYGIKETGIAKAFIGALGLDRHSHDATRLMKWKQPTADNKTAGDFSSVVFDVVDARSTVTEGIMSVDDINDVLDEISRAGKEAEYIRLFTRITEQCTPAEQRWLVRIILKDLGITVKETTVLAVFHPDAMEMFNTSSDLKRVCWLLPNQNERASDADKQVRLFQAFQPMLCKRGKTLKESVKMMNRQEFIMEEKLDGERMQLHKRGNQFFYCSRKGKDYTYLYGATVGEGALTPWIQDGFDHRVTDVILDGEMVVWDPSLEKYCDFGVLKTAALEAIRSGNEDAPRPCFKIFDILYMKSSNGKETLLTEYPLQSRKKTIQQLFHELPGRFEFAISRVGKTVQDVESLLQEVVESRGEGLVLKTPTSKYILGGRENCWMKVKPEYMDNMGETVDVLVVSGNYGKGARGGRVSTLICAVVDDAPKSAKENQTRYVTFVRIGTGLTFSDYDWVNSKKWKPVDRKKPPSWLRMSTAPGATEDLGEVYLEPEDSFIISVKAAAITPTDQYGCEMTMRFPRCTRIRNDLKLEEVLTYSELVATSLGKRKAEDSLQPSKKRKVGMGRQAPQLPEWSRGQKLDGPQETDLFEGLTFRIYPDKLSKPPLDKASLEKLVHQHGGDFTQALTARATDVFLIYGGNAITPPLKKIISNDDYDIFKPTWLLACIDAGHLIQPTAKYYFHATAKSKVREDFEDLGGEGNEEQTPSPRDEEMSTGEDDDAAAHSKSKTDKGKKRAVTLSDTEDEDEDEDSSQLSEWMRIPRETQASDATRDRLNAIQDDTESEADSENESFQIVDENGDEESEDGEDDDAGKLAKKLKSGPQVDGLSRKVSEMNVSQPGVETLKSDEMGEEDDAMEYDDDKLFRHLCFYLDTADNTQKHSLSLKANSKAQSAKAIFDRTREAILNNGGKITHSLDDIKLTHVVLNESDKSRRLELMRRTSRPKRKHLVLEAFIHDCIEEQSLLNEDAYAP